MSDDERPESACDPVHQTVHQAKHQDQECGREALVEVIGRERRGTCQERGRFVFVPEAAEAGVKEAPDCELFGGGVGQG